jgi:hypothetical protein
LISSLQKQRETHARKLAGFQFEEAAFLCEHRITLRSQSEFEWPNIGPIEARIEAHLRALRSFSAEALPDMEGEATLGVGEFSASLRVHACDPGLAVFEQQLADVDIENMPRIHLAVEALLASAADDLMENINRWLTTNDKVLNATGALVLGHKRVSPSSHLIALANSDHPTLAGIAIWALGRCEPGVDQAFFLPLCKHENRYICEIAGTAAMRQCHLPPGQTLLGGLDEVTAPISMLALSATKASCEALKARFMCHRTEHIVQAIGVAGDVSSVPILIRLLEDDELGETAAQALNLMTGANLLETVWFADEIAEEELLDEERISYQADGTLPTRWDGQPFGFAQTVLSKKPETWIAWLEHNSELFKPDCAVRLGLPISAAQSLRTLNEHYLPIWARRAAADELVARYHISEPFEADWMVDVQEAALARIGRLIN